MAVDQRISDLPPNTAPGVTDMMEIVSSGNNYRVTPADLVKAVSTAGLIFPAGSPPGRLTLTSGSPVMGADVSNASAIFYSPYEAGGFPVYDGSTYWLNLALVELTLTLNAAHQTSGNVYDAFGFNSGGSTQIGAGPAWSSTTARGTGAGTTELVRQNGLWVNANSITLWNNATSFVIGAKQATYLGSFYCNANAQVTMKFKPTLAAGGTNNILGLYNAYRQVPLKAVERDSTGSWTYATSTWRAANGNNNNRITFLDGLAQSNIEYSYSIGIANSTSGTSGIVGVSLDAVAAPVAGIQGPSVTFPAVHEVSDIFAPLLGLHFIQAMEYATAPTVTFYSQVTWVSAIQYHNMILRMMG